MDPWTTTSWHRGSPTNIRVHDTMSAITLGIERGRILVHGQICQLRRINFIIGGQICQLRQNNYIAHGQICHLRQVWYQWHSRIRTCSCMHQEIRHASIERMVEVWITYDDHPILMDKSCNYWLRRGQILQLLINKWTNLAITDWNAIRNHNQQVITISIRSQRYH